MRCCSSGSAVLLLCTNQLLREFLGPQIEKSLGDKKKKKKKVAYLYRAARTCPFMDKKCLLIGDIFGAAQIVLPFHL